MASLSYFPQLLESKLFLASPGDVVGLRRMAQQVVDGLVGSVGGGDSLAIFAWETEFADSQFNDSVPIQEQIYRPDDRLCRGLVAFFGEKVGQPLAAGFPTDMLQDLLAAARPGPEHLVHPWRPEAADEGGFPLTGSTFEVLCAIAATKRARRAGQPPLPVFVRFVGPPDTLDEPDLGRANWGNRALRRAIRKEYEEDEDEERRRLDLVREQLKALRNFVLFLKRLGLEIIFEPDPAAIEKQLKDFLRDYSIVQLDPTGINPFLGLGNYDVGHYRIYFGRTDAQKKARTEIEALFDATDRPHLYWIEGSSGSGKSSFLRAGVIGALKHASMSGAEYAHVVYRPNQLLSRAAALTRTTHDPLQVMLEGALAALMDMGMAGAPSRADIDRALEDFVQEPQAAWATWAVRCLEAALARINEARDPARPCRLVIGIDQFEEIVDMTEDAELGPRWTSFVSFIAEVPRLANLMMLATMREERIPKMRRLPELERLHNGTRMQGMLLQFPSNAELETIIRRPFDEYGRVELDASLILALIKEIRKYADVHVGKDQGSVLPLVSLTLLRIHEKVAVPLAEARLGARESGPEDEAAPTLKDFDIAATEGSAGLPLGGKLRLGLGEAEAHIGIEGVIGELAARAMKAARSVGVLEAGDTAVDGLLRQLVRWSGADDKQFSLPAVEMPTDDGEAALARELIRNRLLVDEGGQMIRLVHETVLKHWPEANDFIRREKPLHESAGALAVYAEDWASSDRDRSALLDVGLRRHADAAFKILALWSGRMHPYHCKAIKPRDAALRDYCLALLDATCAPLKVVEDSVKKASHAHLATYYGREDIFVRMLNESGEAPEAVLRVQNADERTPLIAPCFWTDAGFVDRMLAAGADPNIPEKTGWQALHAAAVGGSVEITRCLLRHGAVLDLDKSPGRTHPIHLAALHGHADLVTFYVRDEGCEVDLRDGSGRTPVMRAILADRPQMIHHLVGLGADLAVCQDTGDKAVGIDALNFAARSGAVRSIEALLDLGLSPDAPMKNGWLPLHLAAHNNFPASVRVLAGRMANVDATTIRAFEISANEAVRRAIDAGGNHADAGWTALHVAAHEGHIKVIRALAEKGADLTAVTSEKETALHVAVRKDRAEAAILLGSRADVFAMRDEKGRTPLQLAFALQRLPLAQELARLGAGFADPLMGSGLQAEDGFTLLHKAAGGDDEGQIKLILSHERDIGHRTARGRNALHFAAAAGRDRNLSRLLSNWTGELFERDSAGLTPFDAACLGGSADCAELLAARVQAAVLRKECPLGLHHAATSGNARLVQKLIDMGYDAGATDAEGRTPLHLAAQDGHANVVKELLQNGAKPQRPVGGQDDTTAFELAAECDNGEVLEILLGHKSAAAVDLERLAFSCLELTNLTCLRLLLKHMGVRDLVHPDTGVALSTLYAAEKALALPGTMAADKVLDEMLGPPNSGGAPSPPRPVGPRPVPPTASAVPEPQMPHGEVITQSRRHGLAGDLYPEFEREPRHLWQPLGPEDLAGLVGQLTPIDGRYPLNLDTLSGYRRSLPWYSETELLYLHDRNCVNPRLRFWYMRLNGDLYRLNGTSPPIHEMNVKAPIQLTARTAADYLRFFCFFVRGDQGPFYLCEDAADPLIPGARDEKTGAVIRSTVRPISFEGINNEGHYMLEGVLQYSNAIFTARFAVENSGKATMVDDEPIAADLPMKIDAPLS